jgi:hypothetical protein
MTDNVRITKSCRISYLNILEKGLFGVYDATRVHAALEAVLSFCPSDDCNLRRHRLGCGTHVRAMCPADIPQDSELTSIGQFGISDL